ncbi:hypothetical protein Dimus_038739 [Dionaea muscipula]
MAIPGSWNLSDKVHRDVLPLPLRNGKWRQLARRPLMLNLNLLIGQTLGNKLGYLSLHTSSPKMFPKVVIHLGGTRMNASPRIMSICQQLGPHLLITMNADASPKPQNRVCAHNKSESEASLNPSMMARNSTSSRCNVGSRSRRVGRSKS